MVVKQFQSFTNKFLIIFVFLLVAHQAIFANNFLQLNKIFKLSANIISPDTVELKWDIAPQSYLYKNFIKLQVINPQQGVIEKINFPKGELNSTLPFGSMVVYKNQLALNIPIKNLDRTKKININLSYQGCSEEGVCYPPVSHLLSIDFSTKSLTIDNKTIIQSPGEKSIAEKLKSYHVVGMMGLFLGLGVLLAFTPCILPMIPILFGIIIRGHENKSKWRAFVLSVMYVVGMAVAYALLGLLVSLLGAGIQGFFQNPYIIGCLGLIFVLLALSLFGLFDIALPDTATNFLMRVSHGLNGKGFVGVFLMGFVSALIVSPCVTPPLVGALTYMASTGSILTGTIVLFFLGLGMGLPLIAIATLGARIIPKAGEWMEGVKFLFGVLLLAVAVFLWQRLVAFHFAVMLWGVFAIIVAAITLYYIQPKTKILGWLVKVIALVFFIAGFFLLIMGFLRKDDYFSILKDNQAVLKQRDYVTVTTKNELESYIDKARDAQKPVLIDFYASWCLDCKIMEKTVLSQPDVKAELKRFTWIKVDLSKNSPESVEIINKYGVIGPPTFIFIAANGSSLDSLTLVGMKPSADFLDVLRQI